MLEAEMTEHPSTKERAPMSFMLNPEEVGGGVVVGVRATERSYSRASFGVL